ncbi:hypothetical protein BDF21DRAFT_482273 [Thamnidium elegans]|nr:hypothetical protein BDF21DRAFT_482273 [Thamnidium elegans]
MIPLLLATLYLGLFRLLLHSASNTRINFHKTEAFALSGKRSIYDTTWRTPLAQSFISSKLFRALRNSSPTHPHRLLTVKKWLFFRQFPILHLARNVWYRILLNNLACRSTLHRFIPLVVPIPFYNICSQQTIDTENHFIFECSLKLIVWQELWPSFFDVPFSIDVLKQALFDLKFPQSSATNSLPPSMCTGHTILAIWRSHFNFVFNEQLFLSSVVISLARSLLLTSFREQMVRLGQAPFPLPHFSLELS